MERGEKNQPRYGNFLKDFIYLFNKLFNRAVTSTSPAGNYCLMGLHEFRVQSRGSYEMGRKNHRNLSPNLVYPLFREKSKAKTGRES